MSFGQRLRERREELGMSRAELASRLGVSVSAIGNYETGQNAVREDVLMRLFHVPGAEPGAPLPGALLLRQGPCGADGGESAGL